LSTSDTRDRGEAPGERVGLLRRLDPRGHRVDFLLRFTQLVGEHVDGRLRRSWQLVRRREQAFDIVDALGHDDAELREMCARIVFTIWVRWRTRKSRVLWSRSAACRSADFTGTNRMVGRVTASQIASVSAASVLPRFT
jgi:hypothetical protein